MAEAAPNRVLSVTTQRNEGPYLLEWLAWHRLLGVTDFLVFSNDCEDGSDRLLDLLAGHGVVTHLPNRPPEGRSVQWSALDQAWRHPARKAADWMLISDLDEFPVIHTGAGRIADLLAALPDGAEAVALGWRLFGANGIAQISDAPVTAQFTRSAPPEMIHPIAGTFFKSLFRPASFARPGVHRPRHRKDSAPLWVDGSGRTLPPLVAANDKRLSLLGVTDSRNLAEMHHYSLRSAQSFLIKSERGLPNRADKPVDLGYWVARNFNTQQNTAALRLQPALQDEMAALKALPGVAEAHDQTLHWHQHRADRICRSSAGYDLFCKLLLAADSAVPTMQRQRQLLVMFQAIKADVTS
ncbi:glycosyltransferase family 2 protein [Paracoccus jeotgali]|uniref:Glycosyltransferase family 2 protein n=1 Tax=Paracoccus jeotgali TaxID=2065379 RepID=A0A2K9MHY6_9RHOB|nr:glycosyltransferase family 2 protein [Paracoccus jeotgali]AUM75243.1 glycosyltransferase family 2 protein [Paracoccus jeotgali]